MDTIATTCMVNNNHNPLMQAEMELSESTANKNKAGLEVFVVIFVILVRTAVYTCTDNKCTTVI
jgi:hypothetical protein